MYLEKGIKMAPMQSPLADAPSHNGNGVEATERKKWHAFWSEMPGWVQAVAFAAVGLTVGGGGATAIFGGDKKTVEMEHRLTIVETKLDKVSEDLDGLKEDNKEILRNLRFRPAR